MRINVTLPPDLDLSALEREALQAAQEALLGGVQMIANDAKRSVARGPKSGRIYTRRGIEHQASAPGEPPATDTGRLVSSIVADAEIKNGTEVGGYVEARTDYAAYLEFGTRRMAARPFMVPAVEANRQRVEDLIRLAMTTATQRFARKQR